MFRESVGWERKRGGMTILQIVPVRVSLNPL